MHGLPNLKTSVLLCVVLENCANQSGKWYWKDCWRRWAPSSLCGFG